MRILINAQNKPNYLPALLNFAVLKKDLNEYDGAIELFHNALKTKPNPNETKILFSLSSYMSKQEKLKAKEIIKKILVLNNLILQLIIY